MQKTQTENITLRKNRLQVKRLQELREPMLYGMPDAAGEHYIITHDVREKL